MNIEQTQTTAIHFSFLMLIKHCLLYRQMRDKKELHQSTLL